MNTTSTSITINNGRKTTITTVEEFEWSGDWIPVKKTVTTREEPVDFPRPTIPDPPRRDQPYRPTGPVWIKDYETKYYNSSPGLE
jgi:hypothetical protein